LKQMLEEIARNKKESKVKGKDGQGEMPSSASQRYLTCDF